MKRSGTYKDRLRKSMRGNVDDEERIAALTGGNKEVGIESEDGVLTMTCPRCSYNFVTELVPTDDEQSEDCESSSEEPDCEEDCETDQTDSQNVETSE